MYNVPNHYNIDGIGELMQVILAIVRVNAQDTEEAIYLFNALKYLTRYGRKNGAEDLMKAGDFLARLRDRYAALHPEGA